MFDVKQKFFEFDCRFIFFLNFEQLKNLWTICCSFYVWKLFTKKKNNESQSNNYDNRFIKQFNLNNYDLIDDENKKMMKFKMMKKTK